MTFTEGKNALVDFALFIKTEKLSYPQTIELVEIVQKTDLVFVLLRMLLSAKEKHNP